jgi:histidine triad (HIT) family protein
MDQETIFAKIVSGLAPADIVYQDELVTAFWDIGKRAPVHILIVPNRTIPTLNDIQPEDEVALGRMMSAAAKIAHDYGIAESGYRLIVNVNRDGGQEIYHLHMHLIGGRRLGPILSPAVS